MLAHKVSGQAVLNNTDIQECFNYHAAEDDLEQLTVISQPDVKCSANVMERP
jgi:hypothetical protein